MPPQTRGAAKLELSGRVLGVSGKHAIIVELWDERGFLVHPVERIPFSAGEAPVFRFHVPAGRWAISAFEDQNENGVLDMGLFGPKEPSGFWRAFHAWRKPRFDDVAVSVDHDISNADVKIK
jgi:uncharacterized protein (DUF2141 family)